MIALPSRKNHTDRCVRRRDICPLIKNKHAENLISDKRVLPLRLSDIYNRIAVIVIMTYGNQRLITYITLQLVIPDVRR